MAQVKYKSGAADGATAIGHELDTDVSLTTAGSKIATFKNAGIEKLAVDKDGNILSAGANSTWVVKPEEGGAGIQAAFTAIRNAGGGVLQLLAGTYALAVPVGFYAWDAVGPVPIVIRGVGDNTVLDLQGAGTYVSIDGTLVDGGKALSPFAPGDASVYTAAPADAELYKAGDYMNIAMSGAGSQMETHVIAEDGDTDTGEIKLVGKVLYSSAGFTSLVGSSYKGGFVTVRDLKIRNSSGTTTSCLGFNLLAHSRVENVTVDGGGTSIALVNMGGGFRNTVRNCRFTGIADGTLYAGFTLAGSVECTVEKCHFSNMLNNIGVLNITYDSTRIQVVDNTFEHVGNTAISLGGGEGHIVSRNSLCDIDNGGITGGYTPNLVVSDNSLYECGGTGISLSTRNSSITGNVVRRTGFKYPSSGYNYGIGVSGPVDPAYARNVTVANNTIVDGGAGSTGLYLAGENLSIVGNTLKSLTFGIRMEFVNGAVIEGNSIEDMTSSGISCLVDNNVSIVGNTLKRTGSYGIIFNDSIYAGSRFMVANNIVDGDGTGVYGIVAGSTPPYNADMVVSGNLVRGVTATGISLYVDNSIVTGNQCQNAMTLVGTGNVSGLNKE